MGDSIHNSLVKGIPLNDIIANKSESSEKRTQVPDKKAKEIAREIAAIFGNLRKPDKEKKETEPTEIMQLAHFSPDEINAIDLLLKRISETGSDLKPEDKKNLLLKAHSAVDIAMFGRMLADETAYNTEASVQVAHAITVHEVAVEDDYFTAVDDLNKGEENLGAGHIGESEFAAGLFYLYVCIDRDLLIKNLINDSSLATKTLKALVETAAKTGPTGKQASYASRAYASYILAEKGIEQPRSLSVAFLKPVQGSDLLESAISALTDTRGKMKSAYGKCCDGEYEVNVNSGKGTLNDLLNFIAIPHA
jgi:CRISPR system Cascade subunit CasC